MQMIYPLPPEELDDKTLGEMISACAQTLCNAQCEITLFDGGYSLDWKNKPPLGGKDINNEWSQWARECRANYDQLVKMGLACCREYMWRFSDFEWEDVIIDKDDDFYEYSIIVSTNELKEHKLQSVIEFARDNAPSLPVEVKEYSDILKRECYMPMPTPMPLVMPDKYKVYKLREFGAGTVITQDYLNKVFSEFNNSDFKDSYADVIESYRNYYKARLRKMSKKLVKCTKLHEGICYNDDGSIDEECECDAMGYIAQAPTWTRRTKPEWLGDL